MNRKDVDKVTRIRIGWSLKFDIDVADDEHRFGERVKPFQDVLGRRRTSTGPRQIRVDR
jgi:hypothetical protein